MFTKQTRGSKTWRSTDTFLFRMTILWTMSEMTMTVVEFFQLEFPFKVPKTMPLAYFIFLTTYVLHKEAMRWLQKDRKEKRGEYFLYGWWALTFILYLVSSLSGEYYQVSVKTLVTVTEVSGVYFISLFSKKFFAKTTKEKLRKRVAEVLNSR